MSYGTTGRLLDAHAVITCPHGGRAGPATAAGSDAVLLDGRPVASASAAYTVTGCPHTTNGAPTPCTSIRWTGIRDGVLVDGVPVLLDVTDAQCFTAGLLPQGRPLVVPAHREVTVG